MSASPVRIAQRYLEAYGKPTLDQIGRRVYIRGNTYAYRDDLKALGARWDRDERAWWLSTTKAKRHQRELDKILGVLTVSRATRKQVEYLTRLHEALGMRYDLNDFERMSRDEASKRIDELKSQAKRVSGPKRSDGATPKQIDYALSLIERLGRWGWHDSDYGQGGPPPTRADLETWSRRDVSALIDSLRGEF